MESSLILLKVRRTLGLLKVSKCAGPWGKNKWHGNTERLKSHWIKIVDQKNQNRVCHGSQNANERHDKSIFWQYVRREKLHLLYVSVQEMWIRSPSYEIWIVSATSVLTPTLKPGLAGKYHSILPALPYSCLSVESLDTINAKCLPAAAFSRRSCLLTMTKKGY